MSSSVSVPQSDYNWKISVLYVAISYAVTWSILFPLSMVFNELNTIDREIWHSLGSIGPSVGGIISLYVVKKKEGLKILKERLSKFSGTSLMIIPFAPLIILLIALIFEYVFGFFNLFTFFQQNSIFDLLSLIVFILPSLCYGFFEEIGWRGFFLPQLQGKFSAFKSTLILTIIWWFWHFPAFFYRFDLIFAFVFMLPLMLTGSIVFTYLFNQSRGSLLMVILLHIFYDIVSSHDISLVATILVSVFFICMDVRIFKKYGITHFSTFERVIL
ncbi:MAG: CPBP family intramembrane metalloprotease [Candidatus Lokiarchaeota archaeon]|nr:CPBP family intramembrane metalloprotease [Candidatus Lokiarchaeota archaeon]